MILDGNKIAQWQRGRRRYAIETRWRYRRWYPQSLFSHIMRGAIVDLSNGTDIATCSNTAVNRFLAYVKQPGLDTADGINTYTLAMDYCATMRTVLEYLSRLTLLTLRSMGTTAITEDLAWSFLSYADESGVLHRWKFIDYPPNADDIMKELHSWQVIGDVIVANAPMMLHLVSIGKTQGSRRLSPWCRAYLSPTIKGMTKFQKRSGEALTGNWKPIWFADNPKSSASDWVDSMLEDNAAEPLVQHIAVKEVEQIHVDNFYRDLNYEYNQILASGVESNSFDPMTALPMCRTACDTPYVCPHQLVCYSTKLTLANSGLYDKITRKKLTTEESNCRQEQTVNA